MANLRLRLHILLAALYLLVIPSLASSSTQKNHVLLPINSYQQTTDYTCGPAAVMSLMNFYHLLSSKQLNKTKEMEIAKQMGATQEMGSSAQQMATWLQQHGFEVKSGKNGSLDMLRGQLNNGVPVLVDWVDWGGHWVVVIGYDKNTIYLADPAQHADNTNSSTGITTFNMDRFASMWFDSDFTKGVYLIAIPRSLKANEHAH